MRWLVITRQQRHIVSAKSSSEAVSKIQHIDNTPLVTAKLLPKNTYDKIKSKWRKFFGQSLPR